jgi:L-threonylcarbamoyladenylate synthase
MKVFNKDEVEIQYRELIEKVHQGALFVYPTDTIYGIGCDARNKKAVARLRKIKERPESPFSIWVPGKEWIEKNCLLDKKHKTWLKELPGAYTLIVNLNDDKLIADNVAPELNSVGVRLPDHWFQELINELDIPIVTTSVNKAGEPFMTSLDDIDPEIQSNVDFIVYDGERKGRPSKIVNLVKNKIIKR